MGEGCGISWLTGLRMEFARSEMDMCTLRSASIHLSCTGEVREVLGSLYPGSSLEVGEGSGCSHLGRTQWHSRFLAVCIPGQEREAATCSMKLARLMSRSDKPPQSWVLKVM